MHKISLFSFPTFTWRLPGKILLALKTEERKKGKHNYKILRVAAALY
jgi:hypothetical protein